MNKPALYIGDAQQEGASHSLDIPLLDGELSPSTSREYVLELLTELQNHHSLRNFSHQERFGKNEPLSEKVLTELADTLEKAKHLLSQGQFSDSPFIIESSIRIKFSPQAGNQ